MPKNTDLNDVESRVEAYLATRRESVRALAQTHAHLQQTREAAEQERAALEERLATTLGQAQSQDAQAWSAALTAGWSEDELRRLGFLEPVSKPRTRRRRNPETVASSAATAAASPASAADGSTAAAAASQAPVTGSVLAS